MENEELLSSSSFWENAFFVAAIIVSFVILAASGIILWRRIRNRASRDAGRSLQWFTLSLLMSSAVMFLPVYYLGYFYGDKSAFLRPLLLSVHNAMRLFILDGDFDIILDSVSRMDGTVNLLFSSYAAFLYVAAPAVFTFTIFITIFRDALEKWQYHIHRKNPLYVFSCLNEESAAMAQSIQRAKDAEGNRKGSKSLMVFCSLSRDETEQEKLSSLMPCLISPATRVLSTARDISDFNAAIFLNEITFFLMDRNESQNIKDASALCESLCRQFQNSAEDPAAPARRILVYASSPASGPLIDALSKKVSVPQATIEGIREIIDDAAGSRAKQKALDQYDLTGIIQEDIEKKHFRFSTPYSIMRIDSEKQMAARIVQAINEADNHTTISRDTQSVTITLLGLGGVGKEILESILWTYQKYGCRLIVNAFDFTGPELGDDPDAAHNPLYDRLAYEWPDLMKTNREWQADPAAHPDTESEYDVRFFLGVDCFSKTFLDYFENGDTAKRLLDSTLVICALGDDDRNLEAALLMRQLFSGKTAGDGGKGSPCPDIYAVVYDDQKAENFSSQEQITNYKDMPFHIAVVGSMRSQYSYATVQRIEENEKNALVHHINWVWAVSETGNGDETTASMWSDMDGEQKSQCLSRELNHYIHYDYFRRASLAKASHKRSLEKRGVYPSAALLRDKAEKKHDPKDPDCGCLICQARITEHMRWNAFMRVNGYRYGKKRNDMAKIHPCLLPWKDLSFDERIKD